jgi:hypothetical protein
MVLWRSQEYYDAISGVNNRTREAKEQLENRLDAIERLVVTSCLLAGKKPKEICKIAGWKQNKKHLDKIKAIKEEL